MKKIHIIVNPVAGKDEPVLNVLNRVFREHGARWDVSITHAPGDAQRLAREAVGKGADIVAGYGGDGTLMEIANGLVGSDAPLGILPGGTANSVAREWGIPLDLAQAARLLCGEGRVRRMDMGRIGERYFLLHAYSGMRRSQRAGRDLKDNLGMFAYLLQTIKVLRDPRETRYRLTVDGVEFEEKGIVCLILNALSVRLNVAFAKSITVNDGMLDVVLVKEASLAVLPDLLQDRISDEYMRHWQGREITVRTDAAQQVWIDGEEGVQTPFTAVAAPGALRVVAPANVSPK